MAIYHFSAKVISRKAGQSAIAKAAYNARELLTDERTGDLKDYRRKDGLIFSGIYLPQDAPDWARDREQLWNRAEAAEKRKDATLAREYQIALPHELTDEQRRWLVQDFVKENFTRKGYAADVCIHAPDRDGDQRNYHAHILVTDRRLGPAGFAADKRERQGLRKGRAEELETLRESWERIGNRHLERHGFAPTLDRRTLDAQGIDREPQQHIGVHAQAMERRGIPTERGAEYRAIDARNDTRATLRRELDATRGEAEQLLQELSRTRAVFDERDVARTLFQHDIDPDVRHQLLAHEQVIPLQGEPGQTLYTTATTRANEQATLDLAHKIHGQDSNPKKNEAALEKTLRRYEKAGRPLDAEQQAALRHALDHRFAVIQGRAGTGKSYTLNALRETLEQGGYQVIGLAPTNTAAKDLREAGFQDARTVHSFLYSHKKALEAGRPQELTPRVLIVDEAAMIDTKRTHELLQVADQLKARVVFAGDDRQLASIEAGGMFGVFAKEFGAAELTTVHRQREDWQKDASRAFARGDTAAGMQAYAEHGALQWSQKREDAAAQLVRQWAEDRDRSHGAGPSAFVFAHSNARVDPLNTALQAEQIKAGQVRNLQTFPSSRGEIRVGEGDRLQFRANDKPNGVYNGSLGTVETIDGNKLQVQLDTGGSYTLDPKTYRDFQLGYAGTVYRGQGKTLDNAYVLYSPGMDKRTAYVAMTRARNDTQVFVAREDAADLQTVVKNIDHRPHYGASLQYEALRKIPAREPGRGPPPIPEPQTPRDARAAARAEAEQRFQQRDAERARQRERMNPLERGRGLGLDRTRK